MEEKTETGLQPNIAGVLCYLVGWISGLIFFLLEKENQFIRFHAMQSIMVFGALTVLSIIISVLAGIFLFIGPLSFLSAILGLISTIIWIIGVIAWILLMVKAYQNETYKLPFFGELAEKKLS